MSERFAEVEPRFEMGFYVIDPAEAEQIGLVGIEWYAMPGLQDGVMWTSITAHPAAVNVFGRAGANEPVPEAELDWAFSVTGTFQGEPSDWKRQARGGWSEPWT